MDQDTQNGPGPTQTEGDASSAPPAEHSSDTASPPSLLSGGLGILVALVLLTTAGWLSYRTLYSGEQEPLDPPAIMYICADSGKTFRHKPQPGETNPIMSPYSNKKTAYPAEKCYWTKDGKQKLIPTYVLLNEYIGKKEPTICPDCGRLVTLHNPMPPKDTPLVKESGEGGGETKTEQTTKPADD